MTAPPALTCRELVELVTDYFEGALPADERERFNEHISVCGGCQQYLVQMRETIAAAGALREDDISPEAQAELLAAFRDWRAIRGDGAGHTTNKVSFISRVLGRFHHEKE